MFVQTVNEATTLGWGTRVKGFIGCFVVGVGCTILVRFGIFAVLAMLCCTCCVGHHKEETRTIDVALRVLLALRNVGTDMTFNTSCSLGRKPEILVCVCVLQGVGVLFLPRIGLTLFIVFYTFGNICALSRSAGQLSHYT